jgi:hypothetical protein
MTVTLTGTTLNSVYVGQNPPFEVADLFASGEQGAWYDPSDFTTLFEDSAGTTPITTVERPVGLMLDKSGRGNHAYQTSSAARPALRNRYNLLTYSEEFNNAAWVNNTLVTANTAIAPDGTTTADTITSNGTAAGLGVSITAVSGVQYTASIYAKYTNNQWLLIQLSDSGTTHRARAWFDIQNGVLGTTATTGSGVVVSQSITNIGGGWYRCVLTATNPVTSLFFYPFIVIADGNITIAANGQSSYIWGAQLIVTNSLPSNEYQRIAAAPTVGSAPTYDTDTTKFPPYLAFDGVDDGMITNIINFSATDKMTVLTGLRKLSDTSNALGVVCSLGENTDSVNGTFTFLAPRFANVVNSCAFNQRGTNSVSLNGTFNTPSTAVFTLEGDIANDITRIRQNGVLQVQSNADLGSGNYSAVEELFIGRISSGFHFNGYIYGLIIRGAASSTFQIERTESYISSKMPQ